MGSRIAVAIPGIVLAAVVVYFGGPFYVAAVVAVALIGVYEYLNLVAEISPLRWAAYSAVAVTVILPAVIDPPERAVALGAGLALVVPGVAGLILRTRDEVTVRVGLTSLGALYLGVPLGLLVAARELPEGAGAVANILVGTWAFDTFSYVGGRLWGSHPIAPRISPKKTVEGLVAGVVGGVVAVWVAGLYMDWIDHVQSIVLGLVVCAAAYLGDLFESMIKRDIGVKDSGRLLAEHGGVLDRFDAILFTSVAGYFATVWLT